ncbi:NAD(+)/NADH kinase [Haloarcula sp. CGMCC 1.2071]|uniref:NAD(+)/NADH kinase n=1 Tax=Haloarcula sp. CGMCC 1.2071 TaxID=3111454 RepID=UPI00300F58A7
MISNDETQQKEWETTLEEQGFDIVDEYESDAIVITLGGDGTILHAARACSDPTILPVRTGSSKGFKTQLDSDQLVETLDRLESGTNEDTYTIREHSKIAACHDGTQLRGEFTAVNEVSLHHSSPTLASVLTMRIQDRGDHYKFDRIVGDGVLVATPFGSTAYYQSITNGTFSEGLGVAFNNIHTPVETPDYLVLSSDAVVEVEILESEHASSAALTRDNAEETYELAVGETVEIRQTDESIEILDPLVPER